MSERVSHNPILDMFVLVDVSVVERCIELLRRPCHLRRDARHQLLQVNSTPVTYGTFECVFPTRVQHSEEMSSNRISYVPATKLCNKRKFSHNVEKNNKGIFHFKVETLFLLEIQQWYDNFPPSERTSL